MPNESLNLNEGYPTKLIKHAARSTWNFSKAQVIFSFAVALASAPASYYLGLSPSIWYGILAVLCVNVGALLIIALYNFFRAPAAVHRKQEEIITQLRQQIPEIETRQIPVPPLTKARPNIVCSLAGFMQVEIDGDDDIVRRGDEHIAVIAEFVNQPMTDRTIKPERCVMAHITYFDASGEQFRRINHGSWIDEEWQWVDFGIGDTRRLVLAVQLIQGEEFYPDMDALRAIENQHESMERYNSPEYPYLSPTMSRAEVQLFSANDGAVIGNFAFRFELGMDPRVYII